MSKSNATRNTGAKLVAGMMTATAVINPLTVMATPAYASEVEQPEHVVQSVRMPFSTMTTSIIRNGTAANGTVNEAGIDVAMLSQSLEELQQAVESAKQAQQQAQTRYDTAESTKQTNDAAYETASSAVSQAEIDQAAAAEQEATEK